MARATILMNRNRVDGGGSRSFPSSVFGAELIGTALLVAVGLSIVILDFGQGSPVPRLLPGASWRRMVTGFLFGTTGAAIALSRLGKESGAHINPVVTLAFWLMGRMRASPRWPTSRASSSAR